MYETIEEFGNEEVSYHMDMPPREERWVLKEDGMWTNIISSWCPAGTLCSWHVHVKTYDDV